MNPKKRSQGKVIFRSYQNKCHGYYTSSAYMGWIPRFNMFLPFETEQEYKEFFEEQKGR